MRMYFGVWYRVWCCANACLGDGFMLFEMSFGTLTRLVAVDVAKALS